MDSVNKSHPMREDLQAIREYASLLGELGEHTASTELYAIAERYSAVVRAISAGLIALGKE
jgi:hypothetical protein